MFDVLPDESRIAAEIERLKAEFTKTRELYREVCALLFFRFGITPTANRLYQLVKRGSMSTPTQVLGEFWTELREKSRVRIDHPDLPADLQAAAGELVAMLWTRSTASAQAALDELRTETEGEKVAARDAVASLRAELGRTETALEQRTSALLAAQVRIRDLEQAQAAGEATRQALETEITRQQDEIGARDRALVQARGDFSRELEKLRSDAELAGDRLRAAEKRALLEIERERTIIARFQKELGASAQELRQSELRQRNEIKKLEDQLGDARHRAGIVEGNLEAIRDANSAYVLELKALRERLVATGVGDQEGRVTRLRGGAGRGDSGTVRKRRKPRAAIVER
jgi:chromosome segregation ATPase